MLSLVPCPCTTCVGWAWDHGFERCDMVQVGCSLQGVLSQAKNGDQVFWEEKFHAANGKAQACTQGALLFFLLCFGGGSFFSFFPASQHVCTMFPSSSQWVPNMFPNFAMFSPFSISPHFYPTCLGKWCPPFTYIGGPKGRNYILQNRGFCFGKSP